MLEPEQEYTLAKNWREKGDRESAHTLVTSHLRLVAKIAMGYRGYGLPVGELISEGNIGLMQAVKKSKTCLKNKHYQYKLDFLSNKHKKRTFQKQKIK